VTAWGSHQGAARKPCPEKPEDLLGQAIGMYHCPYCGEMQLAGMQHLPPDDDYEGVMGYEWPLGYEARS
jgi:hypothetical protein